MRQIQNLKDVGRMIMKTNGMPEATKMFANQSADVLNDLPTSENEGKQDCTGVSPNFVYKGEEPGLKNLFAFG